MKKINWLFLIELYAIVFVVSLATSSLKLNGLLNFILFFVIGWNATNLLSYIHGRPMKFFIDNDEDQTK
jgi:hypothetical protein